MSKNKTVREIHIPKAENTRIDTEPKALIRCLDKIDKAKREGSCACYLSASRSSVPKSVISKLIDAKYDISYQYFKSDGIWFIEASWVDGCSGKIYDEENGKYVGIETMYTH